MNYLDIAIAIPLIWALVRGFFTGFVQELTKLLAVLVGIWLSISFCSAFSNWLSAQFQVKSNWLPVISFLLIIIGVLVAVYFLGKLLSKVIQAMGLSLPNKLAGSALRCTKAALVISVMLNVWTSLLKQYHFTDPMPVKESILYKPVLTISPIVIPGLKTFKDNYLSKEDWFSGKDS